MYLMSSALTSAALANPAEPNTQDAITKVKYWRAFRSKMTPETARVLEFTFFIYRVMSVSQQQIQKNRVLRSAFAFFVELFQTLAR